MRDVAADEGNLRLDRWFRRHYPGLSHGRLEKLLRTGQVRVDGTRIKAGHRLKAGHRGTSADRPLPFQPRGSGILRGIGGSENVQ